MLQLSNKESRQNALLKENRAVCAICPSYINVGRAGKSIFATRREGLFHKPTTSESKYNCPLHRATSALLCIKSHRKGGTFSEINRSSRILLVAIQLKLLWYSSYIRSTYI